MKKDQQQDLLYKVIILGILSFLILSTFSMVLYAGGNSLNSETKYSFSLNFLSDLGRKTTFSGDSNLISCLLFAFSMISIGITIICYTFFFPTILPKESKEHTFAILGSIAGFIIGISSIGIGLTPWEISPDLHMIFVSMAFLLGIPMSLFYCISIFMNNNFKKQYGYIFCVFLLILSLYLVIFIFGPGESSEKGKKMLVLGQKLIIYSENFLIAIQAFGIKKYPHLSV